MNSENNTPKRYHYRDCGLDNVWIEGGFDEIDSPYGKGISIHDLDGLHRCIAHCLVNKPGPLTGPELRFLRTELDLSQLALGGLCGRNERTIREWETRDAPVEEPANTIVRFVHEQRVNPATNYEELSRMIKQLQAFDKAFHELKLRATAEGWKVVDCPEQRVA
jgi:DNA-binding transcriptional regulator YiaG